ncbi:(2,3-dihydroxybenzoyl)adenylate synthase [Paracoccus seriniphilus]|uniref:2,3-dihydroxybenzoate-AMP ligase n=1 Tax=Paracoccus seriniphilus TaxID=184748 RepID=A0A239Q1V7_9RHOB|nr:(2,3-dihydroxybenzoyl)adenylate synthase [Paracoccus seriniphilus]WCR15877.1 (2,3-dihydroxybenzoyl)adenylate synthase [Paracoccus seriniphilus]SNT76298.1 2,3-dihydroxybenzoate-AMP ligase [Paracoccus seriniphilus]
MIEFTKWPKELADLYRQRGYWAGKPLCAAVERQARLRPEAVAIICGNRQITYSAFDRAATNLAARLANVGLGQGDTALVQLPNSAEFYITFMALMKIGVAPVNALYSHRQVELSSYAEQIRPRLLVADRGHPLFGDDAFLRKLTLLGGIEEILMLGDDNPAHDLTSWTTQDSLLPGSASPSASDEVAFFQLSGGSTGTPKLIPRTHDDYDYSVRASNDICGVSEATRFLVALPAPHNFLMSSPGALGVFHAGGTVVMAPGPEPRACFDLIARHGVTMTGLVPAAVALWVQAASAQGAPRPLEHLLVGGASFAESLARQVPEVLGCRLQQVFGMAEGLVNYTRLDDPDEVVFTTQGRPISPDDEVRILDENGNPVPDGMPGQLAVRGPYTFRGYYKAPEQNRRAFDAEGFYYSGDLVLRGPRGNLRVVGRLKDQINRGGEKIASEEIEHLLMRHPEVVQAALVGFADEALGEKSCAFIVARREMRASELRRHLISMGIADYKLPDRFRFVEHLPLTAVGKTDKRQLRISLETAPV